MSELYRVRSMTVDDLPMVLAWRNHWDVRRFMFTQHEIGLDEHRNWFSRLCNEETRRLLIAAVGDVPIGCVQFDNVTDGGVSNWGFYADPMATKGTGKKLGFAALAYAFGELNLHKVCGQAVDFNTASIALHERLGFAQEGVLREQQRIQGLYRSIVCFGLLKSDWIIRMIPLGEPN
ncbi:UDP-4-amino-4,6-dideoxy-N-acetyl-beta-L-altrosamine N-acetyltransferase [Mesorhizobium ciceri]|uniref:UDP-4-amino-4, 6-dideoxy-N-acetyl-beta-L-altrosamine N-acetyltransferase n=1 Tax=Mesorhizobium ciceri TaxID=39645 RepID=UPI00191C383F|nr:UDP-4-amino-4,6-dideoxy-N-acetyl-beta-L-altrosamine N-acetyltransferase [Mesorhizobium ciceri]